MINLWHKKHSISTCNIINAGILVILLCTLARSTDYPQNIGPINLTDEMWQLLPEDVQEVFVAPDDRIWYLLNHPATRENLELVYQIIEQQFTVEAPQLYGAPVYLIHMPLDQIIRMNVIRAEHYSVREQINQSRQI